MFARSNARLAITRVPRRTSDSAKAAQLEIARDGTIDGLQSLGSASGTRFVNQVWQAALQNGVPSARICPSCTQPFTTFAGSRARVEPHLEVCTRCYWVWLSSASLALLADRKPARRIAPKQNLLRLAAGVVRAGLA